MQMQDFVITISCGVLILRLFTFHPTHICALGNQLDQDCLGVLNTWLQPEIVLSVPYPALFQRCLVWEASWKVHRR